jgi:hypothetical protein
MAVALLFICALPVMADDDTPGAAPSKLLTQMQMLAAQTEVRFLDETLDSPEFVQTPVFRYSDAQRGFLDATMWVWTSGGRPVAFHKVEAMVVLETQASLWGRCIASVSSERLSVEWRDGRHFETDQAGMSFVKLPGSPDPGQTTATRRLQARRLARGFSGRIFDPGTDTSEEMRLLPAPIYEYRLAGSDLFRGAVFGVAAHGTNPDILVSLEVSDGAEESPHWHYAVARMTNGSVTLQRDGQTVWECEQVDSMTGVFDTWMFFAEPRNPRYAD